MPAPHQSPRPSIEPAIPHFGTPAVLVSTGHADGWFNIAARPAWSGPAPPAAGLAHAGQTAL